MPAKKGTGFIDTISALPYRVFFMLWGLNVILFACAYTMLSYFPGNGPTGLSDLPLLRRFANSLYYSTITATNTGYGDIVPLGASRAFAAIQSVTELFLFALFVSKLVSNRQDIALQEVHKLSFELKFHNIREDFHTTRKDFDHIMESARTKRALTEAQWERLEVAYLHIAGLVQEIPHFYDVVSDLYVIDFRREILLLEAVRRTIARAIHMLETLQDSGIDWLSHKEGVAALGELLATLDQTIPLWQAHSHDQNHDEFVRITNKKEALRAHLSS